MMGKCPPLQSPSHVHFPSFGLHRSSSALAALAIRPASFLPVALELNLATVLSLFSLLLLGHLARSAGIHGNQGKCHQLLGEYQYRQASINIAVTHYQSNGEAATVGLDYK